MQLVPLTSNSRRDWRTFHRVGHYVYANDPHWIAPLEGDIESIFSDKNPACTRGEHQLWVVQNEAGEGIGRVAAFIDRARLAEEQSSVQYGGIGFFECVNSAEAANLLLTTAEDWLRARGMEAADGPINFGERDKFWGLLTRGWYPPVYQESYHAPYYQSMWEQRGYVPHEQCLTMRQHPADVPIERISKLAARVRDRYQLTCTYIKRDNLEQGARWFVEAYNLAFHEKPYFKPLTYEEVYPIFKQMKPIMDPYLTCVVFDGTVPVGFCALIPDFNTFLEGMNGRLPWYRLPQLLYRMRYLWPRNLKGVAFGVHTDYQRKGVFPVIIDYMYYNNDRHNIRTYQYADLATIRGHNDQMVETCLSVGLKIHRVHIAYRKALVSTATWQPFQQLDVSEVPLGEVPGVDGYPTG